MIDTFLDCLYRSIVLIANKLRLNVFLQVVVLVLIWLAFYLFWGFSSLALLFLVLLSVSFYRPFWGIILLSSFVPLKFLLKTNIVSNGEALTIFIPLMLMACFFGKINKTHKENETEKYLLLILLAIIISSAGSVIAYGLRTAIMLDIFIWFQLLGFYFLGKVVLDNKKAFEKFIFINLGIANVVSLAAIYLFLGVSGYSSWIESYELISARATSTMGNPNALAGYLLLIMATSILLILKKKYDIRSFMALIFPLIAFFLTFSRGAWFTAIVIFFAYLLINKKYRLALYSVAIVVLLFIASPVSVKKRVTNIWSGEHTSFSSDSGRIWAIKNVFYINRNHMLFGNGSGSYGGEYAYGSASPTYSEGVQGGVVGVANTDNQWLQVYAQQGAVGLWLYFLLFYYLVKKKYKNILFYPIAAYIVLGLFIDTFQFYQISFLGWLLIGHISQEV